MMHITQLICSIIINSSFINVVLMLEFSFLFISGITGLALGLNTNVKSLLIQFTAGRFQSRDMNTHQAYPSIINFESCTFTDIELNFLKKLVQLNGLQLPASNDDFNDLFQLGQANKQNERIQRNQLLKNLNLKLFFIYGIEEGITRLSTQVDKRKKCYVIKDELIQLGFTRDIHQKENLIKT
jgi:hypothetical protein